MEAEAVEREAKEDRGGKEQDEKNVHKAAICIGQGIIFGIYDGDDLRRIDAEGAIHKGIDENANIIINSIMFNWEVLNVSFKNGIIVTAI